MTGTVIFRMNSVVNVTGMEFDVAVSFTGEMAKLYRPQISSYRKRLARFGSSEK